jgi:hypothetical protein
VRDKVIKCYYLQFSKAAIRFKNYYVGRRIIFSFNFLFFDSYHPFIGYLSASVHGTKEVGTELVSNLQLYKQSYQASKHHCLSSRLSPFIEYLKTGEQQHDNQYRLANETVSQSDLDLVHQLISKNNTIKLMKSSKS